MHAYIIRNYNVVCPRTHATTVWQTPIKWAWQGRLRKFGHICHPRWLAAFIPSDTIERKGTVAMAQKSDSKREYTEVSINYIRYDFHII